MNSFTHLPLFVSHSVTCVYLLGGKAVQASSSVRGSLSRRQHAITPQQPAARATTQDLIQARYTGCSIETAKYLAILNHQFAASKGQSVRSFTRPSFISTSEITVYEHFE
jgi:hypothetical protein